MRNLRRRIEALERSNSVNFGRQQAIAMGCLQPDDVESLLTAYGAERVGRPLTEPEEAARRTYTEALERGCRSAGLRAIAGADLVGAIAYGVGRVLASRMPLEELELCRSGTSESAIRAAYGRGIARANFGDLAPSLTVAHHPRRRLCLAAR